jgi:hypothetical protein
VRFFPEIALVMRSDQNAQEIGLMKARHLLMAGVALLVGAPLALAATPAEEKEITKQLNQQQLSSPGTTAQAQTGATATTEEGAAAAETDTSAAAESEPTDMTAGAEAETDAEAKTDEMAAADEPKEAPDATPMTNEDRAGSEDTDTARHDSGAVGQAANEVANEVDQAVSPDPSLKEDAAKNGVALSTVATPKETLANATVETSTGEAVGEVQSIQTGADGKASAIVVEAGGFLGVDEEPVTITADQFVYIPDRNILVTELNKEQIQKMAEAKTE